MHNGPCSRVPWCCLRSSAFNVVGLRKYLCLWQHLRNKTNTSTTNKSIHIPSRSVLGSMMQLIGVLRRFLWNRVLVRSASNRQGICFEASCSLRFNATVCWRWSPGSWTRRAWLGSELDMYHWQNDWARSSSAGTWCWSSRRTLDSELAGDTVQQVVDASHWPSWDAFVFWSNLQAPQFCF